MVLMNLLGNAWKYTAKAAQPKIAFGKENKGREDAFYVRDNGAGFDMAYADKLFAPFQRLHLESEFEGTGIGLAAAQRAVARHGGHIWADAAVGLGQLSISRWEIPNDARRTDGFTGRRQ
jgi:light-regulated signal transduction histidine kinase (bacteriophytochrome)